ncbi:MAG: MFS transporter [Acidobacteria bacterium]|nr:MFS transporter [Acidobacteriota bacterium]
MEKLKKSLLYTYGVGDMFFVLMVCMEMYYFTAFLTDYAQFSMKTVSLIQHTTSVFDIGCALLAGIMLQKINLKFGGKYRSWFLIGPLPIVLLFALQFTKIGSEISAIVIIIFGFITSHLLWNIVTASSGAMAGRMTKRTDELTILSSSRAQGMAAAGLVFSATGVPLIAFFSARAGNVTGMTFTVVAYGVLMILGYLYIYKMTAGKDPYDDEVLQASKKQTKISIMEIMRLVFRNSPLRMLAVAEIFRSSCVQLVAATAFYYFRYVRGELEFMSIFLLITAAASFTGASLSRWIGPRLGKRRTYHTALVCAGIAYASSRFLGITSLSFSLLIGLGAMFLAIASGLNTALYSDTVVYGEWKTGKNIRAFTMSLQNVAVKLGILIRVSVLTLGLGAIGYIANADPSPQVVSGIASMMSFSPAIVCFIAAAIFFFGYKIQDSEAAKMRDEIAARSRESFRE